MSNPVLYTRALVTINGRLLTQEMNLTIDRDTKAQEIETVALGFAGVSPGSMVTRIKIDNAVPAADFELNPGPFMLALQVVEVGVLAAGRQLTVKMFVLTDNFSHATNSPSKLEMSLIGGPSDWV